ncbi:MAG TPA: glucodextranase DOMON-like domain-containing protein, partial [Candidatus Binatia bacterium]|nr:glucodextranase DOMON-like domain-containing protein [Candidatus Binatia bacterium]
MNQKTRFALPVLALSALCAGCHPSPEGKEAPPPPTNASLPAVTSGHRPGPDILYAPAAVAPQLENTGVWQAQPILVSGAVAYRKGEFLYQDFLYDDHGAMGAPDPGTPYDVGGYLFSPPAGTFTYPTDAAYANNAADLVEFRIKPLADATAFRVTLNTLLDPSKVAFTIALADLGTGGGAGAIAAASWPHGAGVSSAATHFVTVHGTTGEIADAGGTVLGAADVDVDLGRRQIHVQVPHAAWNPANHRVNVAVGVGLWDAAGDGYLAPDSPAATATVPGGASPLGAAIVNYGPRLDEPQPAVTDPVPPFTIGDSAAGGTVQARWWRERAQADSLQLGEVPLHESVDFARLLAGTDDESGVPSHGSIDRIFASHYQFGQGLDPTRICFDIGSSVDVGAACEGRNIGQLQPYALYIPDKPQPSRGWGLTLLLHSLSANYNQYAASNNQSELGERGAGSLVATPAGRGPDGFYAGIPEADTFEVWADVARHYALDPEWVAVTGYSMGGFGTYRMLAR